MKSERELFESKYRFNNDLKYLVFCILNNKYKPNQENEKMHIVQTMADRANSHFATWQAAKTEVVSPLKQFIEMHNNPEWRGYPNDYDKGYADCCKAVLEIIKSQEKENASE